MEGKKSGGEGVGEGKVKGMGGRRDLTHPKILAWHPYGLQPNSQYFIAKILRKTCDNS